MKAIAIACLLVSMPYANAADKAGGLSVSVSIGSSSSQSNSSCQAGGL